MVEARLGEVQGPPRIFKQDWYERLAPEWCFNPIDGAAGPRKATIRFVFRLMPRGTPRETLGTLFVPPYQVEVSEEEPEQVTLSAN